MGALRERPGGRGRRLRKPADDVDGVDASVRFEPDRVDGRGRLVLVREPPGHAQDASGVGGCRVGAEGVGEAPVRALEFVARQRRGQRPVGVAVAACARADHDRRLRLEGSERGDGVFAVAVGPQRERALDGVAAAMPARARCVGRNHVPSEPDLHHATGRDRAVPLERRSRPPARVQRASSARPYGRLQSYGGRRDEHEGQSRGAGRRTDGDRGSAPAAADAAGVRVQGSIAADTDGACSYGALTASQGSLRFTCEGTNGAPTRVV